MKQRNTLIFLPATLKRAIRERCKASGKDTSYHIARALRDYLSAPETVPPRAKVITNGTTKDQ